MEYGFRDWSVDPDSNQLRRGEETLHLEPLAMDVLSYLLDHADCVVSAAELLDHFWIDRHAEPNMVARCTRQIRQALGDDARNPAYIETIRKRGYRLAGPVRCGVHDEARPSHERVAGDRLSAVAVLPFDDLSPQSVQAWLAEGITEELIESLSRVREWRVSPRSSTVLLKERGDDIAAISRRLGVGSLIEGSVRPAGDRLIVIARWIRVSDEHVLWSARYELDLADTQDVAQKLAIRIAEAIREEFGMRETAAVRFDNR